MYEDNFFWKSTPPDKILNKTKIKNIFYIKKLKIIRLEFFNYKTKRNYIYFYKNVPKDVAINFIKFENKELFYSKYIRNQYIEIKYK